MLAYTFGQAMWTMFIFFTWILFFWLLFTVFGDLFRRHDIGGWGKAGWTIFVICLPFLGILVYLIANGHGMGERSMKQAQAAQAQMDAYVSGGCRLGRRRRADRQGEAAARQRRDHAGRVRRAQGEGARVVANELESADEFPSADSDPLPIRRSACRSSEAFPHPPSSSLRAAGATRRLPR